MNDQDRWDRRVRAVLGAHHWPYGANGDDDDDRRARIALIAWAEKRGLRYSPGGRCLHWISQGRCAVEICQEAAWSPPWMDHVTGWSLNRQPAVLLCQPYHLHQEDRANFPALAEEWGLDIRVRDDGWYGHGTKSVELWRKTVSDELAANIDFDLNNIRLSEEDLKRLTRGNGD